MYIYIYMYITVPSPPRKARADAKKDDDESDHPSDFDVDPEHEKIVPLGLTITEMYCLLRGIRKGTNGVSTDRVTANFMFFDRDLLGTNLSKSINICQFCLPFSPICQTRLLLQRPQ